MKSNVFVYFPDENAFNVIKMSYFLDVMETNVMKMTLMWWKCLISSDVTETNVMKMTYFVDVTETNVMNMTYFVDVMETKVMKMSFGFFRWTCVMKTNVMKITLMWWKCLFDFSDEHLWWKLNMYCHENS